MKSRALLTVALLATAPPCQATISVALTPDLATVAPGSAVGLDLVVIGLGNFATPALGGFEFALSYNPAVLSPTSIAFGNHLDLGSAGSFRESNLTTPGLIQLDEVSFESPDALKANQPFSFTLATLNFQAVGEGLSTVQFISGSLSDETGETSLPFVTSNAQVQVKGSGPVSVPDSGAGSAFLALGLWSCLAAWRRITCSLSTSAGRSRCR